jgi:hypothetical protein
MNYDWLIEIIDTETQRSIGKVYTSRWEFYSIMKWPLPIQYLVRRVEP